MDTVTVDLSNLTIHHLDVIPKEDCEAIEFQLHATLHELDEQTVNTLQGTSFTPTEVAGRVTPSADATSD